MFQNNKYSKWYFGLVSRRVECPAKINVERHHIVPKCMGGEDDQKNIVRLTAREHFIAHMLLRKAVDSIYRNSMTHTLWLMTHMNGEKINSSTFERLRAEHARATGDRFRGKKLTEETKAKMRKPKSDEARKRMSAARKGIIFSESHKQNLRHAHGKLWVYNQTESRMVDASTREQLLTEGWNPGRGKLKHDKKADSRTED